MARSMCAYNYDAAFPRVAPIMPVSIHGTEPHEGTVAATRRDVEAILRVDITANDNMSMSKSSFSRGDMVVVTDAVSISGQPFVGWVGTVTAVCGDLFENGSERYDVHFFEWQCDRHFMATELLPAS